MGHRATVNQVVQVGPETTPGTPVPAGKLLTAFTWNFGDKPVTKQFTGSGRQYPSASELLYETSAGKFSGQGDFNQLVYPVSSCFGPVTPALHAGATVAYDWAFKPPLSGPKPKKTYTFQNGDSNDAEQYAFVYVPAWGYSFTRKQEVQVSGDWASQTFADGITLTPSATEVPLLPMTGAQANVYLDSTSAGIGGTQLVNPLKVDFKASNFWLQYFPINRANGSYTDIIDGMPKNELKLQLEADAFALGLIATYLRTGVRAYVRVDVLGAVIEVDQAVGVGAASAGTFTLTYKGQTTSPIAYNALASAVQSALVALSTIGAGGVVVTGTAPSWTVRMAGTLASDPTAMTGSGAGLTGGAFSVVSSSVSAEKKHDMCLFMTDTAELADVDGVYGYESTWAVAEDTAWASGQSQVLTFTNLLSAL